MTRQDMIEALTEVSGKIQAVNTKELAWNSGYFSSGLSTCVELIGKAISELNADTIKAAQLYDTLVSAGDVFNVITWAAKEHGEALYSWKMSVGTVRMAVANGDYRNNAA